MNITLKKSVVKASSSITISGSKSESNRLLLLQALYHQVQIENLSNSDDSVLMRKALNSKERVVDIHHAGTAMRFLTAYFSVKENCEVVLTGSSRMKQRPIKVLVDALRSMDADIQYLEEEGFPPLKIKGKKLTKSQVTLEANVSSQYISALLLVASTLEHGIELNLKGKITSVPYIKMTLSLLNQIGIETSFVNNKIKVKPQTLSLKPQELIVESDWSSASYYYSIMALSAVGTELTLSSYKQNSLQGDAVLGDIYKNFGVETAYLENEILLKKSSNVDSTSLLELDLSNAPDIAQTIAVTAFGLGRACYMTGLHTLKIKETDRLVALKTELEKLGAKVDITESTLRVYASNEINKNIAIATYNDHRMAMAFAPLALKISITIENANVVSKSYPQFWEDLKTIGFCIK